MKWIMAILALIVAMPGYANVSSDITIQLDTKVNWYRNALSRAYRQHITGTGTWEYNSFSRCLGDNTNLSVANILYCCVYSNSYAKRNELKEKCPKMAMSAIEYQNDYVANEITSGLTADMDRDVKVMWKPVALTYAGSHVYGRSEHKGEYDFVDEMHKRLTETDGVLLKGKADNLYELSVNEMNQMCVAVIADMPHMMKSRKGLLWYSGADKNRCDEFIASVIEYNNREAGRQQYLDSANLNKDSVDALNSGNINQYLNMKYEPHVN